MVSTLIAIGLIGSAVSALEPQEEYEAYLAQFEKVSYITGGFSGHGGPVGQPTITVFRLLPGGRYATVSANMEEYGDGRQTTTYFPGRNRYVQGEVRGEMFAYLFGTRFYAGKQPLPRAIEARDEDDEGWPSRVLRLQYPGETRYFDLVIRKRDHRAIAVRHYGRQAQYTTRLDELHLDQKPDEAAVAWRPPPGAKEDG